MSVIRKAEERDIPAVMELLVQVNMVHHRGRPDLFRGPVTKYTEVQLREIFKNDSTPVFVSVDDGGNVQGHAFCQFQERRGDQLFMDVKTLYIDDICVFDRLRGQGVGRALYENAVAFARENGCYNVTLNVWSCNPGAQRFYERCGMVPQKVGMEYIL